MTMSVRGAAALLLVAACAAQEVLPIPDGLAVEARAVEGAGSGRLTSAGGLIAIAAEATALGTVVDNIRSSGAILEFALPRPLPLPACDRLGIGVVNPRDQAVGVRLAVIVRDARGGRWAVSVRRAGLGAVPRTAPGAVGRIETFPWQTAELGRLDPWSIQSLDPAAHDEYDPPRPPLAVDGFRLTFSAAKGCAFSLRDLRPALRGQAPDPYWMIQRDHLWEARGAGRGVDGVGWGPDDPQPVVQAAAFGLGAGRHPATWELLAADGWTVAASGSTVLEVGADGAGRLVLPLLAAGTWRLHAAVARERGEPLEILATCLVVRNAGGGMAATAEPKPLRMQGGGVLEAGAPAAVTVSSTATAGDIRWKLEAADGALLAAGSASAAAGARLDLAPWAVEGRALFLSATLVQAGREVDIIRRIVGFRSAPAPSGTATAAPDAKLAPLAGTILRTKGDWHEGGTPVVSRARTLLPTFAAWMDDAKAVGYNIVELSAPWYDVEPLPGVRQFAALDRLVAEARGRGLRVVLRVHPIPNQVPAWVAREYQEDEDGAVHGLWRGSTNPLYSPASPALRGALDAYLEALAARYRADPWVVGYTVSNLFFDHGLLDEPWTGQAVDYSETARRSFAAAVRARHGDLARAAAAHGVAYRSWDDVAVPHPQAAFDAAGRLQARSDARWREWTAHKVAMIADFRAGTVAALRRGDPGCAAGTYLAEDTPLWLERQTALGAFIACGSMEDQYPPVTYPVPVRREPHAKAAAWAPLVDIGMTNILFARPGHESFFNYWFPEWRLAEGVPGAVNPGVRAAEERLRQWFRVVDHLAGAEPALPAAGRRGAVAFPLDALLMSFQHTFTPRAEDLVKPFWHRLGAEKLRVDTIHDRDVTAAGLTGLPWLYLPYCANQLDDRQADDLVAWVEAGGRLVVEPTSGYWRAEGGAGNQLGRRLGLPDCPPVAAPAASASEALVATGAPLAGLAPALRTDRFLPPVQDQPVGWIHNIPRAFLRPYALAGASPAGATVVATGGGGRPAAYLLARGRGQVLVFAGVIDWLGSPGLARRLDDWGCGRAAPSAAGEDPELLASPFNRGPVRLVVGRRFVGHAAIGEIKGGRIPAVPPKALAVALPHAGDGRWQVRELLSGRDLGAHEGAALRTQGVTLDLQLGEGFIIEADRE